MLEILIPLALTNAERRYTIFEDAIDPAFKATIEDDVHAGRITLVEHNFGEAIELAVTEGEACGIAAARNALNKELRICAMAVDQNKTPYIRPEEMLHPLLWQSAVKIISGTRPDVLPFA